MIASPKTTSPRPKRPAWHAAFLAMLPAIVGRARVAFRQLDAEARQDALQEVTANATAAFVRLVELDKMDLAYPTVLARYAVAQYRAGRRVGSRLNVRDVLSPYAQRQKQFQVERLDRYDGREGAWREAVVEDYRTPPAEQAAFRCDFPAWLAQQSQRDRQVAEALCVGNTTGEVARQFGISPARVSQLRRALHASWLAFHGDQPAEEDAVLAAV